MIIGYCLFEIETDDTNMDTVSVHMHKETINVSCGTVVYFGRELEKSA